MPFWESLVFSADENNFYWLTPSSPPPEDQPRSFYWKMWKQLMRQLKEESRVAGKGFWPNRRELLSRSKHMMMVVPVARPTYVVGFYVAHLSKYQKKTIVIRYFQSFVEGKGYGRMMLNRLSSPGYRVVADSPMLESRSFWKHCNISMINDAHASSDEDATSGSDKDSSSASTE